MKQNKQNKQWCRWCGELSTHKTPEHIYQDELKDKNRKTNRLKK